MNLSRCYNAVFIISVIQQFKYGEARQEWLN